MKLRSCLLAFVCIFPAFAAPAEDAPKFILGKEINAMAPRNGTLTKRSEYSGSFKTEDGKEFVLGGAAGGQEVWHFVATLKEGQSYKLPDAFVNYCNAPCIENTEQILAMGPRVATLASRTPCSAYFTTPDGKGFHFGGPGSGAQVSQFLWSLEAGPAYKFPEVFIAYQAAPSFGSAEKIKAMEPRTGKLTGHFQGFCYFATTDGKGFAIGARDREPETERDVRQFLETLKEDATYKFPEAFLDFQKGVEQK